MKISLDWLREYVSVKLTTEELCDRLNMIGLVVESVERSGDDVLLELETYANRPDTLGHLGVAREIAAMLGTPMIERSWPLAELDERTADATGVQILDPDLCPRYTAAVVRGVTVGPSPDWLRKRIEAMGLRPINNVVDITNFILYDTAQPIHAFDLAKLGGGRVVVRKARRGEKLTDLEGRALELDPEMLVIADESKPAALAGVIGGQDSAVSGSTRDVFIESANFAPVSIRKTAKKLGLSTDASYRFERGADLGFPPTAAVMAASLLCRMGGKATAGLIDVYPKPHKPRSLVLRQKRVAELLGVDVPEDFTGRVLAQLGFRPESSQKGVWRVECPSFRVDIDGETDLIEEVARFYGYDRIPSEVTPVRSFTPDTDKTRARALKLRETLLAQGFDEVINFSFSDPERESLTAAGRTPLPIRNPISAKASVMRTGLLAGLLETAARNLHRGLEGVHVFEAGNVFSWDGEKHDERLHLGLLATGWRPAAGWQESAAETDVYVLKGAVEAVLENLRYEPVSFAEAADPSFEEGQALDILYKGQAVGRLGLVRPAIAAQFAVERPVYAAEIDLARLFAKTPRPFHYVPVPKFPGVVRDLSLLVDTGVAFRAIREVLDKLAPPLLESWELRDRFAGKGIPEGKVGLTLRFRYRHPGRTLVAEDVDLIEKDIVGALRSALSIQLREGKIDIGT